MADWPMVGVIVQTHNRSALLVRSLVALAKQNYPRQLMEVVVVADGCRDDTVKVVQGMGLGFVRVIEQTNAGAGNARNAGAAEVSGELLVFLDDDVEAAPQLLQAHVDAHRDATCQPSVVIGYTPATLSHQSDWLGVTLMNSWECMFDDLAQPGRRFAYTDLLKGNFSVSKALFMACGGFDATLGFHEDDELGFRLLRQGAAFFFARAALGHRCEIMDLRRLLARNREQGRADVRLGQLHPALVGTLHLSRPNGSIRQRLLRYIAMRRPAASWALEALLWLLVMLCGNSRRPWDRYRSALMRIYYWRGVAENAAAYEQISSNRATTFIFKNGDDLHLDLDLGKGILEAENRLNASRPMGMRIRYGNQLVGLVPADPLRERLHAGHLRPLLARHFSRPLLAALNKDPIRTPHIDGANCDRSL